MECPALSTHIAIVNQPWGMITPPVTTGGSIPILLYELARRIARDQQVSYYTRGAWKFENIHHEGIDYRYLPVALDKLILKIADKIPDKSTMSRPRFAAPWWYAGYGLALAASLRKHKADIIHLNNLSQLATPVRKLNPKAQIAIHMHCEWLTQIHPTIIGPRIDKLDMIIGVSDFITERIRHRFTHFRRRCHTLHNGVDIERFSPGNRWATANSIKGDTTLNLPSTDPDAHNVPGFRSSGPEIGPVPLFSAGTGTSSAVSAATVDAPPAFAEEPTLNRPRRVVFVGRLSPEKGVHILIDAFKLIAHKWPDVKLVIIGPDEINPPELVVHISDDPHLQDLHPLFDSAAYRNVLSECIKGIEDRVEFVGNLPHGPALVDYYRSGDVCVFPSIWDEPFGMPVVEAMACGSPVITTTGGAYPELVNEGVTGLMVPKNQAEPLAGAIDTLLSDAHLRRQMGIAGRKKAVEQYSWDVLSKRLMSLYGLA